MGWRVACGDLSYVEPILERTDTLQVATGIVNVWSADAEQVADSYHRIEDAYPGRFLLGVGIGHPEHTEEYRKPYDALVEYLDVLDESEGADQPARRRRAGPKVLSWRRSAVRARTLPDDAGAHRAGARM